METRGEMMDYQILFATMGEKKGEREEITTE